MLLQKIWAFSSSVFFSRSAEFIQPFQILETPFALKTDDSDSCEEDWFPFGNKCYKIGGSKMIAKASWEDASTACNLIGGSLARVSSKEIHEFLVAFLLLAVKQDVWIGSAPQGWNKKKENKTTQTWPWRKPESTTSLEGDCLEMQYSPIGNIMNWYKDDEDYDDEYNYCNVEQPYICETNKVKRASMPANPMFCSSEDQRGWKYANSCFNFVSDKETWFEAESCCQEKYQGHLVTIKDIMIETFLNFVLRDFKDELWIGIKIREQWQQKWSSGWHVVYNNWEKNKTEFLNGTCVVRTKQNQWNTVPCTEKFSFICEKTTDSPPALKPSVENTICPNKPNDWIDLDGDYCYFFVTKTMTTWKNALFNCMARGGSLASIHSQLEIDVILPFLKMAKQPMLIGLYRLQLRDAPFAWTDGSPVDFTSWKSYHRNSPMEFCGIMELDQKWISVRCNNRRAYICSVKKISSKNTTGSLGRDCSDDVSRDAIITISIATVVAVIFVFMMICYFHRDKIIKAKKVPPPPPPPLPTLETLRNKEINFAETYWRARYRLSDISSDDDPAYEIMN